MLFIMNRILIRRVHACSMSFALLQNQVDCEDHFPLPWQRCQIWHGYKSVSVSLNDRIVAKMFSGFHLPNH